LGLAGKEVVVCSVSPSFLFEHVVAQDKMSGDMVCDSDMGEIQW